MPGVKGYRCIDVIHDVANHECVQVHDARSYSGSIRAQLLVSERVR
jgi:hypothetical protein